MGDLENDDLCARGSDLERSNSGRGFSPALFLCPRLLSGFAEVYHQSMEIRSLALDWRLDAPSIQRDGFFGQPSLCAVDAVFIDPKTIPTHWSRDVSLGPDGHRRTHTGQDRGFGKTISAWMMRRRQEASDLLIRRGGILVCRLHGRGESLEIIDGDGPGERIDRWSFLPNISLVDRQHQLTFPSNGRFLPRRGEDVVLADSGHPFEAYLAEFEGQIVYDAVYQDVLSTPIERFATVLARNRVGDAVALSIPYDEGRLILLPPIEGVSPSREAAVLLDAVEAMVSRPTWAASPDWLPSYPLPGEDGLADEVVSLQERRDALYAKLEEVSGQLSEKTAPKRMLYTKGRFSFVEAVGDGLRALGFDVNPSGDVLEISSEEGDGLVVAEATDEAAVGLPAYRRLRDAVDQSVTDGEPHRKGILIVSGSLALDPKRRPTQYADGVLRGCEAQGFCLATSYELFKIARRALGDRTKKGKADLRKKLLEADGVFRAPGAK